MSDYQIKAKPFTWNDNFSEIALEDFSTIQKKLPYCTCQSIGMALAKLALLEKARGESKGAEMKEIDLFKNMIVDYSRANECKQESWGYTCYKCGKCGRKFENGFMVDDGGTTVSERE